MTRRNIFAASTALALFGFTNPSMAFVNQATSILRTDVGAKAGAALRVAKNGADDRGGDDRGGRGRGGDDRGGDDHGGHGGHGGGHGRGGADDGPNHN
jgi:hypothetical protein